MEEIHKVVRQFTEKSKANYAKITDEDLEIERVFALSNFKAKGKTFLTMMYDHEIHHKGQLFVYARMAGVKVLPFFRDFK
ncbi:DinB family protein [Neobacillus fumarioli]|uniref:DinB family protein n=1 Tax=Neobacillus fumarioli TaxID=105229 RepID=UPI000A6BB57E